MSAHESISELRFKRSSNILNYIHQFSATEKVIFGVLCLIAAATAIGMALKVNSYFMVELPTSGGELREGEIGLPRTINPVLAVTDADRDMSELVYSGLMKYDGDNLVPDLAEKYTVSDDGLTYTFSLRPGLHFQDGSPLTSDDIAYTIQKVQDPTLKSPRHSDWDKVSLHVVSPTQIQFILKQPYSLFLTNTTIGILPKALWENITDDQFIFSKYNIEAVGSGPYKIGSIKRDNQGIPESISLSAWKGPSGVTPYLSTISFHFFADYEKAASALTSGNIDALASVAPDEAAAISADHSSSLSVMSAPLPRIFGVFFNQDQAVALADKNVRTALDMAVDRSAIVRQALSGYASAIHGPLPESRAANSAADIGDIGAAQALLERTGWTKNANGIYQKRSKKDLILLSFDLYTVDSPDLKATADLVKQAWTKLGADVTVKIYDSSDLFQNVIKPRKYDALLFGEFVGKDRDLYAFWHSSQRIAPGLNIALYANSRADKLLEDIRTTTDADARAAKYTQFSTIIKNDLPAIFLFSPDFTYAVPKALRGVDLSSVTVPADRFNSVTGWYTETDKVWKIFAHDTQQ